jgi:hypothetical protein
MADSTTARALVDELVAAGEWPTPQLLEDILGQGEEAVEPLREVVRRDVHGWPDEAPLCFAIDLLGSLGAMQAIPDLVDLFRRYDNETLQSASATLGVFGAAAVDAMLPLVREDSLDWYQRSEASTAAILAAGEDVELRERVAATLREILAADVARASELDEDEKEWAASVVTDLTHMADPKARELIQAAFDADALAPGMIDREDVDYYYSGGEEEVTPPKPRAWLEEYKDLYAEEMEGRAVQRHEPLAVPDPDEFYDEPRQEPFQHAGPHIGRNDPCWCGSGKKYKNCHLELDREQQE